MATSTKSSEGGDAPLYRKPRADVFTFLLVVALLALILATTMLWLIMRDYKYDFRGGPTVEYPKKAWVQPHLTPRIAPSFASELPQNV